MNSVLGFPIPPSTPVSEKIQSAGKTAYSVLIQIQDASQRTIVRTIRPYQQSILVPARINKIKRRLYDCLRQPRYSSRPRPALSLHKLTCRGPRVKHWMSISSRLTREILRDDAQRPVHSDTEWTKTDFDVAVHHVWLPSMQTRIRSSTCACIDAVMSMGKRNAYTPMIPAAEKQQRRLQQLQQRQRWRASRSTTAVVATGQQQQ